MKKKLKYLLVLAIILSFFLEGKAFSQKKAPVQTPQNPFEKKEKKVYLSQLGSSQIGKVDSDLKLITRRFRDWKEGHRAGRLGQLRIPEFLSSGQKENYKKLYEISERTLKIYWDKKNLTPIFITGKNLKLIPKDLSRVKLSNDILDSLSLEFLHENRMLLRIENPREEFKKVYFSEDKLGMKHLRYQQMYKGIEVWGREIYVHLKSDNTINCFNGRYLPTPSNLTNITPSISEGQAIQVARDHLNISQDQWQILEVKLALYHTEDEVFHLAWLVDITDGLLNHWFYFIEAHRGEFLHRVTRVYYDGPVTGSGVDLHNQTRTLNLYQIGSEYCMIDASKPMFDSSASTMPNDPVGVVWTLDAQNSDDQLYHVTSTNPNSWPDKATVSGAYHGGIIYDYYNNVHSRNSIDGNGMTMPFIAHFKTNYNNAFWNGKAMIFGDGDGVRFSSIIGALDVAAHEVTHGVTQHTANLIYQNQAGALNESFSDVFGTMIEFYEDTAGGNWLIGEDIFTPATPGDALRDMQDPASSYVPVGDRQPTKMSEYQDLPNTKEGDWGGVHINSGIPNRACFQVADSIGRSKTEQIYYRALTNYLTQSSQFIDARIALCNSAADLYGADGPEEKAIKYAFDVVEVFGDSGSPPPDTLPPVEGEEWVAAVDGVDLSLWRFDTSGATFEQLTTTPVFGKPSVTEQGDWILFVDTTYNLRIIGSDGQGETPLTTSGIIWSIAISPDGEKLAYTKRWIDTTIFIMDLTDTTGASDKEWKINRIAELQGETAWMLYADALDWKKDSEHILYDAINMSVINEQDTTYYWSIYSMRASDGTAWQIFPSQSKDVSVGNPVYASNNDYIIAFDFVDTSEHIYVLGANLETGNLGVITDNYYSLGFPSYSNDDSKVIYEYYNGAQYCIYVVGLQSDKITGAGEDNLLAYDGMYPVWFAIGERPVEVEENEEKEKFPYDFVLKQNYPNPFNAETVIEYQLPKAAKVKVSVYNILGQRVTTLIDQAQKAGYHKVSWDGTDKRGVSVSSGIYFYEIQAGELTECKKMVLIK